jgi:hypothetical protein
MPGDTVNLNLSRAHCLTGPIEFAAHNPSHLLVEDILDLGSLVELPHVTPSP